MKTFLNVGMNDEITEAWGSKEKFGWTAWDCYRRFLQSWGMSFGVDRDVFDSVMSEHKERQGVELKIQFTNMQMRDIAYDYKKVLLDHNIRIEPSPMEQLKTAIRCVLDSWSSESSVSFRDYMQIAEEWGTAVLVQKMVLGNLNEKSGTGVVFTSSPLKDYSSINLYGDFAICSQGEDVVSGLVNTLPISETQRKKQYNGPSSLESAFPQVYQTLQKYARQLIEQHGFVHQEIEFTFDGERPENVYILQTRNQKITSQKAYRHFAVSPSEMQLVGRGIGVSGGILSGVVAFDMEDMNRIKEQVPEAKIILVRPDTVPDDIPMLFVCNGLLTAKGGATSHAAVTAVGLGKVCIVKCEGLQVKESQRVCSINGHLFHSGDPISIDGDVGSIYAGNYDILEK
ncbi:Pyruvate, phosphate dikinase [bioreactor metagenome]|uniref:Pyruvate, phosphate dikinase n=1 Tax=bioreactor metagenome TaxID=1076179 RepID=A0A645C8I6_9ZZZZ